MRRNCARAVIVCAAAVGTVLLAGAASFADTVVSSFGTGSPPFAGNGLGLFDQFAGSPFTPAATFTLDSATLAVFGGANVTASLYSDSSGAPGTSIETLGTLATGALPLTYTSSAHSTLTAGVQYWVVAIGDSGGIWYYGGDAGGSPSVSGTADLHFSGWIPVANNELAFSVTGDPVAATPEPSSLALMSAPIPALGVAWFRRRKAQRRA